MGKLFVVGNGPGNLNLITNRAKSAIENSDFICGYEPYINQISELISKDAEIYSNKMKGEIERVKVAIEAFEKGKTVSLVCGGDASLYSMASLVLELVDNAENVEIIPGVTAALSASAKLGAPVSDDLLILSMSDLLTPWELIKKRIDAANSGDFVTAVYNPRSKKRTIQLPYLINRFLEERGNLVCGYVKNSDRENEELCVCKLKELDLNKIDMSTVLIIGNTKTFIKQGKMVSPRGYTQKYGK